MLQISYVYNLNETTTSGGTACNLLLIIQIVRWHTTSYTCTKVRAVVQPSSHVHNNHHLQTMMIVVNGKVNVHSLQS